MTDQRRPSFMPDIQYPDDMTTRPAPVSEEPTTETPAPEPPGLCCATHPTIVGLYCVMPKHRAGQDHIASGVAWRDEPPLAAPAHREDLPPLSRTAQAIAALVGGAGDKGIPRDRLAPMLYMADVLAREYLGHPITEIEWTADMIPDTDAQILRRQFRYQAKALEQCEAELASASSRVTELERQLSASTERNGELERELKDTAACCDDYQKSLHQAEARAERAESQFATLTAKVEALPRLVPGENGGDGTYEMYDADVLDDPTYLERSAVLRLLSQETTT